MKLSCEFLLVDSLNLSIGSFIEISLYKGGNYVNRSFGSSNFHVRTNMYNKLRLCGLGRNSVIQLPFEDFPEKIHFQSPTIIFVEDTTQLEVLCKTNIFMSKESFIKSLYLKLTIDATEKYICMNEYPDEVESIEHGRFLINLSNLLFKNS